MDKQQQQAPTLTKDLRFPYWKSGEEVPGVCDGCGRSLPLLVLQDIAARRLLAFCKACYADPPAESVPPGR